jgi:histidine triad (HIT) family protein
VGDSVEHMVADCLFCKIVAGEIPAKIVHDDDAVLAFEDVNPKAPTHVLVVPKRHLANIGELGTDPEVAAAVVAGVGRVAAELGLDSYRTVFNTGSGAGQTVFHVHAHLLGGRGMSWPPG